MRIIVSAITLGVIALSNVWSYNQGVDYGVDAGVCTSMVLINKQDPRDISFCDRADPQNNPIKYNLREGYLILTDSEKTS